MAYYAHTTKNPDKSDWQPLKAHLIHVADLASGFAQNFGAGEFAYAGGLLHDLGKYSPEFQRRLEGAPVGVDHSTAGALEARSRYHPAYSRILEYIVTGHHGGLLNYGSPESGLEERLQKSYVPDYSAYSEEISVPDLHGARIAAQPLQNTVGFTFSFYTRMLYSCLVDADSLDTEAFTSPEKSALRGHYDPFDLLSKKFEDHMDEVQAGAEESGINRYRHSILEQCRKKATLPPGMFTLTVPTGGGKTLSSMAFALDHLKQHGLQRIFYIIPYTSIIEQNARVFRDIFGGRNVLEHHSNFDPSKVLPEEDASTEETLRLSSENWDMPIVVTTNVQFFESLFSSRRSRCRKLHNLTKSVIILDEAQMLPTEYLKPCLATLAELVRNYGSTVVICTATQPKLGDLLDETLSPIEITDSPEELYEAFRRVRVHDLGEMDDVALVDRLRAHPQVLCIVNTRNHAKNLYDSLKGSGACYHLSARMCPAHRSAVLAEIKVQLEAGVECRVISTQLIEAGVDIDFPVVYRAMTGIDSIAQASGRCNREGRLESGEVYLFMSTEPHGRATGWQRRVAEIGEMILDTTDDPLSLPEVAEYFQRLYFYEGDDGLDRKKILSCLEDGGRRLEFPFEDVDAAFRIIESGTKEVIVPYDENARSLIQELKSTHSPWEVARRLQPYTVSVYANEFRDLEDADALESVGGRFFVLKDTASYSEETGLLYRKFYGYDGSLLMT
ncbi:CRISPR-associated endonuclease/helicase Cas3/CRISPR-associated endonuclease Cas3-HD [Methanofollis sp. W23]|uniref:CRISPR-associated helicase Cas3' n=1 Tax=Methanofollis sp. W23 TaxID=2817849 RepID=UPI001AE41F44|nr:CRISPR-associated helicase Cas3' [Methanofollis sp. W23]MBP2144837.1 CRISPR-associated endonuclease/helicase Cas3/CRISPR-associated endonuclease Cas3-HD [Methanofollis sp. W23]